MRGRPRSREVNDYHEDKFSFSPFSSRRTGSLCQLYHMYLHQRPISEWSPPHTPSSSRVQFFFCCFRFNRTHSIQSKQKQVKRPGQSFCNVYKKIFFLGSFILQKPCYTDIHTHSAYSTHIHTHTCGRRRPYTSRRALKQCAPQTMLSRLVYLKTFNGSVGSTILCVHCVFFLLEKKSLNSLFF